MRILLFGSGSPASIAALDALARVQTIAAVVVPDHRAAAPLIAAARERRIDVVRQQSVRDAVDLICIATFPSLLSRDVLRVARLGAINVHMSLLPKHRGPDPLFWTYIDDDRETGVTVHWVEERADAGPIILQRSIALERGRSIVDVYMELSAIGAELLVEAVRQIASGTAARVEQDETRATLEPSRDAAKWPEYLAKWPAERVWHVVKGLTTGPAGTLLRDERGRPVAHGQARGFTMEPSSEMPGTVRVLGDRIRVFCIDGVVDVAKPPRRSILRRLLR
ncbi:MAG TPA: formyltransferase family protein [Thermoanaerobaculia bacterium]